MPISLLVVSPSDNIRNMLARYLASADFSVYTADSASQALSFLQTLQLDALVTDLDLKEASGLDLLLWINQHAPAIHPVVLCDGDDSDLIELLRRQSVSVLQKNRLNLFQFRALLQTMCQYKRGVTYQFSQISLFELVQLASRSSQARHVYLTSPLSGQEGMICFQNSRARHALYDAFSGEEAFYEIMRMKQGLFQETDLGSGEYFTIESSLDQLMALSALRSDQRPETIPPTQCTLYSGDMALANYLLEHYPQAEMELFCTDIHDELLGQIARRSDLLIIDLDLPDLDPQALLEELTEKSLLTRILIIGSQVLPQLNTWLAMPQVDRFFLKPAQFDELGDLIHQAYLSQQFSGSLHNLQLFNVLQTFTYFRQPRLLEVTDFFTGLTGQIFIANGEVEHATFGDATGRDALKQLLNVRYGLFCQETYWEPVSRSLNVPLTRLMLYLTRYLEQQNAEPFPARDLLLQDGRVLTLQAEKINYLLAISRSEASLRA